MSDHDEPVTTAEELGARLLLDAARDYWSRNDDRPFDNAYFTDQARHVITALIAAGWRAPGSQDADQTDLRIRRNALADALGQPRTDHPRGEPFHPLVEMVRQMRADVARAIRQATPDKPDGETSAQPVLGWEWVHGFPPRGTDTAWRCQKCHRVMAVNRRECPNCRWTVFDPGYMAVKP